MGLGLQLTKREDLLVQYPVRARMSSQSSMIDFSCFLNILPFLSSLDGLENHNNVVENGSDFLFFCLMKHNSLQREAKLWLLLLQLINQVLNFIPQILSYIEQEMNKWLIYFGCSLQRMHQFGLRLQFGSLLQSFSTVFMHS